MSIQAPGIYSMSSAEYHRDPALSSTGARLITLDCPAVYRHQIDNPPVKREFDIGNATHLLVLEPPLFAGAVREIDADDYRTKAAQEARDAARAEGRLPLLRKEIELVHAMRDAVWSDPIAGQAFRGGQPEQSMFWRDPEFGIMCRTRPDYLPPHTRYLVDLKTAMSADPEDFARQAYSLGYHMQAAWYLDGVEAITGTRPERFAFVVVSKKPPHIVTTCWLDNEMIEWGRIQNRHARGVFAWCQAHDRWPSYQPDITAPPVAHTISLPGWARKELEAKHEAGAFEPPVMVKEAAE